MTSKLLRFFLILIINIFCCANSFAQVNDSTSVVDSAVVDSSETSATIDSTFSESDEDTVSDTLITQAFFKNDEDSILKWRRGREFSYMAYLDSMLKKRKDLKKDTMDIDDGSLTKGKASSASAYRSSNSSAGAFMNSGPVKVFFWIMAILFILFIVYKLFFKSNLFARGKIVSEDPAEEEPEKLGEFSEYFALINEAENNHNYNLAIRYLYLQSLRRLSEKEVIVFMPDKTNYDYVRELAGSAFHNQFAALTNNYEYAWYGKREINKDVYTVVKEKFTAFNKII